MTSETEEILMNIARIIHGWREDYIPHQHVDRLESLEKFILTIEDYDKPSV